MLATHRSVVAKSQKKIFNTLRYYLNLLEGLEKCRFSEGDIIQADINPLVT